MTEIMTDRQYDGILQMIEMIVDSCKDLEEAKQKFAELRKEKRKNGINASMAGSRIEKWKLKNVSCVLNLHMLY